MATAHITKFRLPHARILQFNLTGKSRQVSAADLADDALLRVNFPGTEFKEPSRSVVLAALRGEDLRRFSENI